MRITLIAIKLLILTATISFAQNENYTHVIEHTINTRSAFTKADIDALPANQKPAKYTFYDAFGRKIQEIHTYSANDGKDIVQPFEYDELGREPKEFLPFVHQNTVPGTIVEDAIRSTASSTYQGSAHQLFYSGIVQGIPADPKPYTLNLFHPDRPDMLVKKVGVGQDWHTGVVTAIGDGDAWKLDYGCKTFGRTNNITLHESDRVLHWKWHDIEQKAYVTGAEDYYEPATLSIEETWDEQGRHALVFIDSRGFKVAKKVQRSRTFSNIRSYLTTYYIYDNIGKLRFTLSPKFVANRNFTAEPEITYNDLDFKGLCFYNEYNEYGQLVFEQKPGPVTVEYVYDPHGRAILTQTSQQMKDYLWSYVKYDELGRVAYSGIKNFGGMSRSDMQKAVDNFYGFSPSQEIQQEINPSFVKRDLQGEVFGYTNDAFPYITSGYIGYEVDHVYYYDDYTFKVGNDGYDDVPHFEHETRFVVPVGAIVPSSNALAEGLQTGKRTRVLTSDGSLVWLCSVIYYDEYGRIIQQHDDNQLDNRASANDIVTSKLYNEFGAIVSSVFHCRKQLSSIAPSLPAEYLSVNYNEYDNIGRLVKVTQGTNSGGGQPEQKVMLELSYNDLGQVLQRKLGNSIQTIDYSYNIRGWITSINDSKLIDNGLDQPDVFGIEIDYQTLSAPFNETYTEGYYDGRIAGVRWMSSSDKVERSYKYDYDDLGQLTKALFNERQDQGQIWDRSLHDYTVSGIHYDENGNILRLKQNGLIDNSSGNVFGEIDNLTYTYDSKSNRPSSINDAVGHKNISKDFNDYQGSGTNEYVYNDDGSLTDDLNKNIHIEYNYLGLAAGVDFLDPSNTKNEATRLEQLWAASGTKLHSKTIRTGRLSLPSLSETYYVGPLVICTGGKKEQEFEEYAYMQTPAGRCVLNRKTGEWTYEYHIQDHQGNLRAVVQESFVKEGGKATMELTNQQQEEHEFELVAETRHLDMNNARTGAYASLLNPALGDMFGPMKMVKVAKGDTVNLEAYAHYPDQPNPTRSKSKVGRYLSLALGGAASVNFVKNREKQHASVLAGGALMNLLIRTLPQIIQNQRSVGIPDAGLRYIIYDKDSNFVNAGGTELTSVAENDWEALNNQIIAQDDGYVQFYVINESPKNVLFDDIGYEVRRPRLVQENHYYPFGLSMEGIEQEGIPDHGFQFSGKEQMEEYGLDYMDFGARAYDPQTGRWWAMDPMSSSYPSWSPYNYCFNDPLNLIDPDGRNPVPTFDPSVYAAALAAAYPSYASVYMSGLNSFLGSQFGMYPTGLGYMPGGWYASATGYGVPQFYQYGPLPWQPVGPYLGHSMFQSNQITGISTIYTPSGTIEHSILAPETVISPSFLNDFINMHYQAYNYGVSGLSYVWNSPVGRAIVPDYIHLGVGYDGIVGVGASTGFDFNWLVRGPEASWKPVLTMSEKISLGGGVDLSVSYGGSHYLGPVNKLTRDMLNTNSVQYDRKTGKTSTTMPDIELGFGINKIAKAGFNLTYGFDSTITRKFSLGMGWSSGLADVSVGTSNTWTLYDWWQGL